MRGLFSSLLLFISVTAFSFNPNENDLPNDLKPTDVIHWRGISALSDPAGKVQVALTLETTQGFGIYTHRLKINGPLGFSLDKINGPGTRKIEDPLGEGTVEIYENGEFEIYFSAITPFKDKNFNISLTYVGCTQRICLYPHTEEIIIPVVMTSESFLVSNTNENANTDLETSLANQLKSSKTSLWTLLLIVFLGGLLTNLTPCVYPMIPITIRLLSGQGSSALLSSTLYAGGIVISYTVLGIAAAMSGTLFGSLLASKAFNIIFACIMFLLGMTMLGYGNLSSLQMMGSRVGSGRPSKWNTFLMGTGAGLVASPCTGPILATLLALTAESQDVKKGSLLMFVYSFGFGLPYVFLGGTAAKLSKIKVHHHLQTAIKYIFAAIMFGLSFYYLRIPLYGFFSELREYWPTIALYGLTIGGTLTMLWIYSNKLQLKKATTLLPTIILGIGIFGLSQQLTSSLTIQENSQQEKVAWLHEIESALNQAKEKNRPIILDAWAEWCEACKKMDATTFMDPNVQEFIKNNFIPLKLDLTESNDKNDSLVEKYSLHSLPTLVLLPTDGNLDKAVTISGYVSAPVLLNKMKMFYE